VYNYRGDGSAVSATALLTANLVDGRFALSNSGSVFSLAQLLEDGTAIDYRVARCAKRVGRQHLTPSLHVLDHAGWDRFNPVTRD
jgi:hypothetical protein